MSEPCATRAVFPFASSEVEKRVPRRVSTSLDTNGAGA
jgi:hypothetical protein